MPCLTSYLVTLDEPISKIFLDIPPPGPRIDHRRVLRGNVLRVQSGVEVSFIELRRSCHAGGGKAVEVDVLTFHVYFRSDQDNYQKKERKKGAFCSRLQLELVVADGEVPIEEQHAFDTPLPVRAQRLPLLLFPAGLVK